jgi:tRNA A-37 threonylcarbamoyl transferase component Bud32/tetratricopeptide (TPR) repeat protein
MIEPLSARLAELLCGALDQSVAQRATWVERECAGDIALTAALSRLLELDARADLALDRSIEDIAAEVLEPESEAAQPDQRIGPYRLLRKLGQGGMGAVWLAERIEGGFAQQVALKLIRLGLDSAVVQAQFRRERELLASLAHADIARLLDGGVDAHGRPWFAMEYVEGVGLREWIERSSADARTRLDLFLRLCRAVAYAHQRLIVHRDLKPSNVLVRVDGSPCLLDFGIAKLIEADNADATATEQRFLTRAYAAPEQLRGEPVTTVTDVFALGVLLFELLTGLHYSSVRKDDGAITRPSAVLARQTSTVTAAVPPAQLRGDLDAIVLHALAEDPRRRYPTAVALADDVDNFLHGRTVKARPDSVVYRISKLVRRNRIATAAIAAAVLFLIAGTGVSLWQAQRAERMAVRAERGKDFLVGLLQDANPFDAHPGRQAPPDKLLDAAIARLDRDFTDAPAVQIEMRALIYAALHRIGDPAKALALARRNVDATRSFYGAGSPQLGVVLSDVAQIVEDTGDVAAAHSAFAQAEALLRDAGRSYARDRISVMTGLAKLDNQAGNHVAAHQRHAAVLREREALEGPESPDIAMDLMNMAADALYSEHYAEAESLALRAHTMAAKLLGPEHARLIYVDHVLGLAQLDAGHAAQAVVTMTGVVRRARATLKPGAPQLGPVLLALGSAQYYAGDNTAAIATLSEACAIGRATNNPQRGRCTLRLGMAQFAARRPESAATLRDAVAELGGTGDGYLEWAQAALGAAQVRDAGDAAAGEALIRNARSNLLAGKDAGSSRLGEIDELLAGVLDARGDTTGAHAIRSEALAVYRRIYGPAHPRAQSLAARL